jgi:hypothetical protein
VAIVSMNPALPAGPERRREEREVTVEIEVMKRETTDEDVKGFVVAERADIELGHPELDVEGEGVRELLRPLDGGRTDVDAHHPGPAG